jgi:bacterioferritin (cytochrome b1)
LALAAAVAVLPIKYAMHYFGLEFIEQTSLHNSVISSIIFVLGFVLSATIADYKESERIPSEFAANIEDMYNDAAEKVDEIAERILMLGGTPENKFSEYLKVAKVKEISGITCGGEAVEHILETYSYLIGEERKVIELANEAGDDATADLMTGYLKEQEKMVWMLVAFSTKSCAKYEIKSNKIVG